MISRFSVVSVNLHRPCGTLGGPASTPRHPDGAGCASRCCTFLTVALSNDWAWASVLMPTTRAAHMTIPFMSDSFLKLVATKSVHKAAMHFSSGQFDEVWLQKYHNQIRR